MWAYFKWKRGLCMITDTRTRLNRFVTERVVELVWSGFELEYSPSIISSAVSESRSAVEPSALAQRVEMRERTLPRSRLVV